MRQGILAIAAVLGLLSLAFGGDLDGHTMRLSSPAQSLQAPAVVWLEGAQSPPVSKNEPVMAQRGGKFVPAFLVVVAGQTVSMPNEDQVAHNVYSLSTVKAFNLGFYAKGDVRTVTFDRPGLVDVLCVIHNFMRAKILVVPNPYYAMIAADGTFHIRSVPPERIPSGSGAQA
jgi:plastocyanin